ncbi:hypothetical protein [Vibrio sp. L3-7]|nr:hypothetical protein [Vibrio sp. L3-7]
MNTGVKQFEHNQNDIVAYPENKEQLMSVVKMLENMPDVVEVVS